MAPPTQLAPENSRMGGRSRAGSSSCPAFVRQLKEKTLLDASRVFSRPSVLASSIDDDPVANSEAKPCLHLFLPSSAPPRLFITPVSFSELLLRPGCLLIFNSSSPSNLPVCPSSSPTNPVIAGRVILTATILEMLEARLEQAQVLKKIVDAIKDLVQDCNFDCNDSGIALQAMDNSHVALVSMMLKTEAFSPYRCDRNIALGVNLTSLTRVLRAAQNEDLLTIKAEDAPDVLNLVFESSDNDRISEYDLKLMDIDQEHLGIPETEYGATVSMPSAEFRRICTDLMAMSDSGKMLKRECPARPGAPCCSICLRFPAPSYDRSQQGRYQVLEHGRHRQRCRHSPKPQQR